MCIENKDLNKETPKDDFPLPYTNMLIDSDIGQVMYSFLYGFFLV